MTILFITVPFEGHMNALIHLMELYAEIDIKLMIIGWNNYRLPDHSRERLKKIIGIGDKLIEIYANSELKESCPLKWTEQRVNECLNIALDESKKIMPDKIVYDSFTIEGYLIGQKLKIPSICSCTTYFKPFNDEKVKELGIRLGIEKLQGLSDGIYIKGDLTLVWSYNDKKIGNNVLYVGYPNNNSIPEKLPEKKMVIFVSFGTVVMGNLWNKNESVRKMVLQIMDHIEKLSKKKYKIYIATQGILKSDKWNTKDRFNQLEMLSQCDLFITHGGNNSYQEALLCGIPMVVIPFFGDQNCVASEVYDKRRGLSLLNDNDNYFSTEGNKFREISFENMENMIIFASKLKYEPVPPSAELSFLFTNNIPMNPGDLLFGTKNIRLLYQDMSGTENIINMCKYLPFSKLITSNNTLPSILDIYNDSILNEINYQSDMKMKYPYAKRYKQLLQEYRLYLNEKIENIYEKKQMYPDGPLEPDFSLICCCGIDFFLKKGYTIHFIVSEADPLHYVTSVEKEYLNKLDTNQVKYYKIKKINGYSFILPFY